MSERMNIGNFSNICKWKILIVTVDTVNAKSWENYESIKVLKFNFKEISQYTHEVKIGLKILYIKYLGSINICRGTYNLNKNRSYIKKEEKKKQQEQKLKQQQNYQY